MKTIKAAVANVLRRVDRLKGLGPVKGKDPKKFNTVTEEALAHVTRTGTKARPAGSYRANRHHTELPSKQARRRGFSHYYDLATEKSIIRSRMRKHQGRWDGKGDPGVAASLREQAA